MTRNEFPMPRSRQAAAAGNRARKAMGVAGMLVTGALFGAGVAWLAARWAPPAALTGWFGADQWDLFTLACVPVLWLVAVAVHELGHLAGGRAAGMQALSYIVGPLQIDFRADGWHWQRNRSWSAAGGLALVMPSQTTTRHGLMLMVAGGPLASVLLAGLALAVVPLLSGWWAGLAGALALVSALIGLMTSIPMRAGLPSDGSQLLGLLRHDPNTRQRMVQLALLGATSAGARPREWEPTVVAQVDLDTQDVLTRSGSLWLAAIHATDRGDNEAADRHWQSLAEQINAADDDAMAPGVRATWALAIAAWVAQHREDAAAARGWLAAASGAMSDPASRAMVDAAIAVAERADATAATSAIARARAAVGATPYRGLVPVMIDQLDALAARIDRRPQEFVTEAAS
jgi:hypothetical protein